MRRASSIIRLPSLDLRAVPTGKLYQAAWANHVMLGRHRRVRRADDDDDDDTDLPDDDGGLELKLGDLLGDSWDDQLQDGIDEILDFMREEPDAVMGPEDLDDLLARIGPIFGDDFAAEVEDDARGLITDAYSQARELALKPLGIKLSRETVDERAEESLQNDSMYWIGSYWDRTLGAKIADTVNDLVIQKGLSRVDAGAALQTMLGGDFPDKSRSYWNLVASAGVQRSTVFGQLASYRQTGATKLRFINPQDIRSSEICLHLARIGVFPAGPAYDVMDSFLDADDPDAAKDAHPWPDPEEILSTDDPAELVDIGIVPPLHGHCVPGYTLIETDSGERRIDEVAVGDSVLTHLGRFRRVTRTFENPSPDQLVKLTLASGRHILGTEGHPALTSRGWVVFSAVRPGDCLFYARETARAQHAVVQDGQDPDAVPAKEADPLWRDPFAHLGNLYSQAHVRQEEVREEHLPLQDEGSLELDPQAAVAGPLEKRCLGGRRRHRRLGMGARSVVPVLRASAAGALDDRRARQPLAFAQHSRASGDSLVGGGGSTLYGGADGSRRNAVHGKQSQQGMSTGRTEAQVRGHLLQRQALCDVEVGHKLAKTLGAVPGEQFGDDAVLPHAEPGILPGDAVVKTERIASSVALVYNLSVDEDESYVADGYVLHNCRSELIPVEFADDAPAGETDEQRRYFFQAVTRFDEEKHPRGPDGKFGKGNAGEIKPAGAASIAALPKSLGIPRKDMPQIRSHDVPEFLQGLRDRGIAVTREDRRVGDLKPTQGEINIDKAKALAGPATSADKPIIVASDDYILDGHHRWAGLHMDSPENTIPTNQVDMPIHQLLAAAHAFPKAVRQDVHEVGPTGPPQKAEIKQHDEVAAALEMGLEITPEDHARADANWRSMAAPLFEPVKLEAARQNAIDGLQQIVDGMRGPDPDWLSKKTPQEIAQYRARGEKDIKDYEGRIAGVRAEPAENFVDQYALNDAVAAHFKSLGLGEQYSETRDGWMSSSVSYGAYRLHGVIKSLGVPGSFPEDQSERIEDIDTRKAGRVAELMADGAKDAKLRTAVKEMYLLTQASLRAEGKSEIAVYRGIVGQGAINGQKAMLPSRPVSSWAGKLEVAERFGRSFGADQHVLTAKVSASRCLFSPRVMPNGFGEGEFAVLGASDVPVDVSAARPKEEKRDAGALEGVRSIVLFDVSVQALAHEVARAQVAGFEEDKHPRDATGKFTVLGTTASGKPVFAPSPDAVSEVARHGLNTAIYEEVAALSKGFTSADHRDAAALHRRASAHTDDERFAHHLAADAHDEANKPLPKPRRKKSVPGELPLHYREHPIGAVLAEHETAIHTRGTERAIILDSDGKVVFQKDGSKNQIGFTESEAQQMKDCVLTHNHPRRKVEGPDGTVFKVSSSLSPNDVATAARRDLREVRAVGTAVVEGRQRRVVYRIQRPAAGWPDSQRVHDESDTRSEGVKRAMTRDLVAGRGSYAEEGNEVLHRTWTEIAPGLGLTYERVLLD